LFALNLQFLPKADFVMIPKPLASSLAILSLALIVVSSGLIPAAQAQFKPPNRGAPSNTAGGATRGNSFCVTGKTPLTVLVPSSHIGLTTTAHPTFFVYVPPTSAKSAEFVLQDAKDNDIYRTTVELTGTPGIVSLSLPETAPPLEMGKDYLWYFSIVCQPKDRLEDVFVSAWVQRVQPTKAVVDTLKRVAPRDRPGVYAKASYWYDTLSTLAELRRSKPNDASLNSDWTQLLNSVGLSKVAKEPLSQQPSLKIVKSQ
jgi:hypothetical protein